MPTTVRDASSSLVVPDKEDQNYDGKPPTKRPSRKALWGLYCVYFCIGIVYGFFAPNISGPLICHYKFGPFGQPGGTDSVMCSAGSSLFGFSWQIKVFIALFVENFPIMGTRKRYWIIGGWAFALTILGVTAFLIPTFLEQGGSKGYSSWVAMMTLMDVGVAFADVAADGMAVSYSKLEPDNERGSIISTNYQCRFFTTMVFAGLFKMLFMGGDHWVNPQEPRPPPFSFDLKMQQIHFVLLAVALVPFVGICLWIEDPPLDESGHHETGCRGVVSAVRSLWICVKSYAVWMIVIYCIGMAGLASLVNPADQIVSDIANADSIQTGTGTIISYAFLVMGLQIFKRYFVHSNLRHVSMWSYVLNAMFQLPELALVYVGYKWPAKVTGFFYQIQADLPSLMQAISFCLVQLLVVDIAPAGLEASVYEFLLTAINISQSVAILIQGLMARWFDLNHLGGAEYKHLHNVSNHTAITLYHKHERSMASGILITVAIAVGFSILFSFFLPRNAKECREWAAIQSWHVDSVAACNFTVLGTMIVVTLYGLVGNLTSIPFFQADMVQVVFVAFLLAYVGFGCAYKLYLKCGHPVA